jgi:uncharacterized small protein (DUF1192 family)
MLVGMADEAPEEKLARYEHVIGAQMTRISELTAEIERLRAEGGAAAALREVYLNPNSTEGNKVKAAAASLPFERAKLMPEKAPLDLVAEPAECLADVVHRQRMRMDRILALPLEERSALFSPGNSGNGDASDDDTFG